MVWGPQREATACMGGLAAVVFLHNLLEQAPGEAEVKGALQETGGPGGCRAGVKEGEKYSVYEGGSWPEAG